MVENGTILIIDDEDMLVSSLSRYLTGKGFKVRGTIYPEEALSILQNERFDTVLTDLRMVPISGIEIVRYLKGSGFAGIIVVMSAYFKEFEKDLQELGVDCCLEKPFMLNKLLDAILPASEPSS
jgi:two-component system, NtrC family, response regulator PilR